MQRTIGPVTSGTYIAICSRNNQEDVASVETKGSGYGLLGTRNRSDENTEWCFESLGNDRVRAYNKKSGSVFRPLTYAEGVSLDKETGPIVFIFKETENKGEYVMSFDDNPSWYICPVEYGTGYMISADPKQCLWSFWKIDN